MSHIRANIYKMYVFRFLRDFWLIMPMLIPFYKSFHLTNTEILVIQSIFSLSQLLFEIPSGYFSDAIGRRLTLIIGALSLPVGLTVYAFGAGFLAFAIAEGILGFGFALCSGTESALIYDSLIQMKKEDRYHKIEGFAESLTRFGTATASIAGGVLALAFLKMPFYFNIATSAIMVVVAITFLEPDRVKRRHENPIKDIFSIVRYSLSHPKILSILLLTSIILVAGIISIWGYLMMMQDYGYSVALNGVGFALFQVISAAGALTSHKLYAAIGRKNSYRLIALIPLMLLVSGLVHARVVLLCSFLLSFIWGFSFPFFMDELNKHIESSKRATVLSTGSMVGRLLVVGLSPLFGLISDTASLGSGFLMLAGFFICIGGLSYFCSSR